MSEAPAEPNTAPAAETSAAPLTKARAKRRFVLEVVVFVGIFLGLAAWRERNLVPASTPAPAFTLSALDGKEVSLDSLRGKRVLVHFWATWCGVCRMEFGALDAVNRRLSSDEALVTIVADSDDPREVSRFVAEHHIDYPVLLATPAVVRAFHVGAFPTSYYLDPEGRISSRTVGMATRWSMLVRLALAR